MMKKIIVTVLLVGLIGILLIGAVNRTLARTGSEVNGQGRGKEAVGIQVSDPLFGDGIHANQRQDGEGNGWDHGKQGFGSENSNQSTSRGKSPEAGNNGRYLYGGGEVIRDREFIPKAESELSVTDREALILMREEEKLAHDVYQMMYELWGIPIFRNISSSEQSHTEAVKTLLDGYNVPDPVSDEPGDFTNPDLQILYDDLVAQGSRSLSDALRVGAAIEEMDILDLQEHLAQTHNADIQHVFTNLLNGSGNHLRAFTSTLMTQNSEIYQPQFMSMDEYQSIISETIVNGGQGRGARGGRGG